MINGTGRSETTNPWSFRGYYCVFLCKLDSQKPSKALNICTYQFREGDVIGMLCENAILNTHVGFFCLELATLWPVLLGGQAH